MMIQLKDGDTIAEVHKKDPFMLLSRPDRVESVTYKIKSPFIKQSVYVTLGHIDGRPIEIFINSKDLKKNAEYAVLTRLISAIFRRGGDVSFILEELRGIWDANGGFFKNGKYIHSFYAEVADVIETFFRERGIITDIPVVSATSSVDANINYKICPECGAKALKTENGSDACVQCGYSKCDK